MSKQFSFRFDDTLYAKTKKIAKKETRTMSNLIQHLCRWKIEEYEAAAEAILFAMGDSVELKKLAFALQVGEREAELIVRYRHCPRRHRKRSRFSVLRYSHNKSEVLFRLRYC